MGLGDHIAQHQRRKIGGQREQEARIRRQRELERLEAEHERQEEEARKAARIEELGNRTYVVYKGNWEGRLDEGTQTRQGIQVYVKDFEIRHIRHEAHFFYGEHSAGNIFFPDKRDSKTRKNDKYIEEWDITIPRGLWDDAYARWHDSIPWGKSDGGGWKRMGGCLG